MFDWHKLDLTINIVLFPDYSADTSVWWGPHVWRGDSKNHVWYQHSESGEKGNQGICNPARGTVNRQPLSIIIAVHTNKYSPNYCKLNFNLKLELSVPMHFCLSTVRNFQVPTFRESSIYNMLVEWTMLLFQIALHSILRGLVNGQFRIWFSQSAEARASLNWVVVVMFGGVFRHWEMLRMWMKITQHKFHKQRNKTLRNCF